MYYVWLKELLELRRAVFGIKSAEFGEAIPFSAHRVFITPEQAVIGISADRPAVTPSGVQLVFPLNSSIGFIDAIVRADAMLITAARKKSQKIPIVMESLDFCNTVWMKNSAGDFMLDYQSMGLEKAVRNAIVDEDIMIAWRVMQSSSLYPGVDMAFDFGGELANWVPRLAVRMPSASEEVARHLTMLSALQYKQQAHASQ